ncbi:hypothetical protein M23134_05370 [Microscilla marina ATCC 23134]|uniref:Uncharacterized protein n=1 Tax=Microscilla marina ATCC 23134 TaxID=313606 RepID=A1ZHN0_MICM2|nr:hypothetical protein M23134_05370 [Microscilla marina ATCC 23134]
MIFKQALKHPIWQMLVWVFFYGAEKNTLITLNKSPIVHLWLIVYQFMR